MVRRLKDEPIPTTGQRLDKARFLGIVAQDIANLTDAEVQSTFKVDERISSPQLFSNGFAGNQLSRRAGQQNKDSKWLRRKLNCPTVLPNLARIKNQFKCAETDG